LPEELPNPLTSWLTASVREGIDASLTVTDVTEAAPVSDNTVGYLADRMLSARIPPELLTRVTERIGWQLVRDAYLALPRISIRNGALGETIASSYLAEVEAYEIPCEKSRVQIDVNQTLPGTDLVSVRVTEGSITEVHFLECKLRTVRLSGAALGAYAQLVADQGEQFATILMFTLIRLYETKHPLFEPFLDYLQRRSEVDIDSYGIFLVLDDAICRADPVVDVLENERSLAPLHIRSVRIASLAALIDMVYQRINASPVVDPEDVV
jgi:hypothetical protein